jgi:hypothetical protein
MNRMVPFVLTGFLSSALTLVVVNWYLGASGMDDIGMLKARADLAVEEHQKLADEVDKLMFTKKGDFRFPDLTNSQKQGTYLGKPMMLPVIDYR